MKQRRKKKVLVIDDEPGICEILVRVLGPAGYSVLAETNPMRGLELVESEKPDCVILDIRMPMVSGMDVLARIMEIDKDARVIMVTGGSTLETAMQAMEQGAYDCITKPFDLEYIKTVIARCLKARKR